jgi:hypothetical protein
LQLLNGTVLLLEEDQKKLEGLLNGTISVQNTEDKIKCICGATTTQAGMKKHEKTIKHKNYVESIEDETGSDDDLK